MLELLVKYDFLRSSLKSDGEGGFAHLLKRSGTTLVRFSRRQTTGYGLERNTD